MVAHRHSGSSSASQLRTAALLIVLWVPPAATAQHAIADEGALDLLLPTGARSVALGQATMALSGSAEAVWWNPSGLARMRGSAAALHHSQSLGGTAEAVSVVAHSRMLGSFGVSASLRDLGSSESADPTGAPGGTLIPRSLLYAATYAAALDRVTVGLTYKYVQERYDCTGPCIGETGIVAATSALDVGAQLSLDPQLPVTVGVGVRNLGLPVQVNDEPQADALPSRVQAGTEWRVPVRRFLADGASLRLTADLVSGVRRVDPAPRFGAELGWQDRLHLRAGWASRAAGVGGTSLGLGYERGRLAIDFARLFDDLSGAVGMTPTYLSFRYQF